MLWQGRWGYITGRSALEGVAAPAVALSNATVTDAAAIGATVGTLSVTGGSGSYSYALTSNPGSLFAISGSSLKVASSLAAGTVPIAIQATGGTPSPVTTNFFIVVTASAAVTTTSGEMLAGAWQVRAIDTVINAGEP